VRRAEALALPVRARLKRLPASGFEAFSTTEVTVDIDGGEVGIALDGELLLAPPPFPCTVRARSLCTLVPGNQ
jgi:hypothetical protein